MRFPALVLLAFFGIYGSALLADRMPTFESLTTFGRSIEHPGRASLVLHTDGAVYGTMTQGGSYNCGGIYKVLKGVYTPLLEFTGKTGAAKGSQPQGALLSDGNWLWGVTISGGANDEGTVYKFDTTTNTLVTVVEFGQYGLSDPGFMGVEAFAGLVRDGNGMLWGTTQSIPNWVYKIDPATNTVTRVVQLSGTGGVAAPGARGELVFDGVDSLWGVVPDSPVTHLGLVYKVNQNTGAYTQVVEFTGVASSGVQGGFPAGALVPDGAGSLIGLASSYTAGFGEVYRINIATGQFSVPIVLPISSQAGAAEEGLVDIGDGNFAGMTTGGALFVCTMTGHGNPSFNPVMAYFTDRRGQGSKPLALVKTAAYQVMAATSDGGAYEKGVLTRADGIFGTGIFLGFGVSLGLSTDPELTSGTQPSGGLVEDTFTHRLWGLASTGGTYGDGVIYSLLPTDSQVMVASPYHFTSSGDGRNPVGELVRIGVGQFSRGYWKGLTAAGGNQGVLSGGYGTEFMVSASQFTNALISTRDNLDYASRSPVGGLAMADDGSLWAASNSEVYFHSYVNDLRTTVATFTGKTGSTPGTYPGKRLLNDRHGYMWGVTMTGGASDRGTIYKVQVQSLHTFTSVVQFTGMTGASLGQWPYGALTMDDAGMIWGTTMWGGDANHGTVFKLDPATGNLTTVVQFREDGGPVKGRDPEAGLVSDGRGHLWGSTSAGGASDCGTLFRLDPATGAVETQFEFTGTTPGAAVPGSHPSSPLVLHSDGSLYGTAGGATVDANGVPQGGGSIFRVHLGHLLAVTSNATPCAYGVTQDFGSVYDAEDVGKKTFTVTNTGTTVATGLSAVFSGAGSADFSLSPAFPATLAAGASVTFDVSFAPSTASPGNAVLTVQATDGVTDPFVMPLKGQGLHRTVGLVTWGSTTVFESGGTQSFLVKLSHPLAEPLRIPFTTTLAGGAKAADFTISTSPVIIPAGSTSAAIWLTPKNDYLFKPRGSVHLSLGTPDNATVSLVPATSVLELLIQDDDITPALGGGTAIIVTPGQPLTIDGQFGNPSFLPFTGWWTHDGRLVGGATQPVLSFAATTTALAGSYQFHVKLFTGQRLDGYPITVTVVDATHVRPVVVKSGVTALLPTLAAGFQLGFQWRRTAAGGLVEYLTENAHFSGTSTGTLRVSSVTEADAGDYFCVVGVTTVQFKLEVETGAPQPLTPAFTAASIGKDYSYLLPRGGDGLAEPSSVVATGLPLGLVCDKASGIVSGRPKAAGHFKVTVAMSNSHGSAHTEGYLDVAVLPTPLVGTFAGQAGTGIYSGIGSRLDITTSGNGTLTGVLAVGAVRHPFAGNLVLQEDGTGTCAVSISTSRLSTVPMISLSLTFSQDNRLNGQMDFLTNAWGESVTISGWRCIWNAKSNPMTTMAGYHTLALVNDASGAGCGHFTIGQDGSVTIAGNLPDSSAFATNVGLDPNGWFLLYQPLYPESGGLSGLVQVKPPIAPDELDLLGDGSSAIWVTPPKAAKTRYFQYGVSNTLNHPLKVLGGGYAKPAAGTNLLDLPVTVVGTKNAQLQFTADPASLPGALDLSPNVAFRLATSHVATLPLPGSVDNPGRVASLAFNAGLGTFSGTFTLDYRTPNVRTAAFKGVLLPALSKGLGYFIVATPADPKAVPPVTMLNSPMASGTVQMSLFPTPPAN